MAVTRELAETRTAHEDLISSLEVFYRTFIDLDYLREEEVQFHPHTGKGKIPLATTAIQGAGLTREAELLLHLLPYITPAGLSLFRGESRITLSSKPLSYLTKGRGEEDSLDDERSFGYGDDGEVLLPAWALQIFGSSNSSENTVIYDTRNKTVSELSIYEPTEDELSAAATSPGALIGAWTRNLRSLAWIPWRDDDELWGMQTLDEEEEEQWLADPEKWRQELIARNGPTTLNDPDGNPVGTLPTAEQRFTWDLESATENHNQWWAKRLVYEGAGWPDALDKDALRTRIRDFERERIEAIDNARPDGSKEDEAENEFYRRAAGQHGI